LKIEEESWRQKRRVTWLVVGDRNTRYFHKIVEGRRKGNIIWEIMDGEGRVHTGQKNLQQATMGYFKELYSEQGNLSIINQLNVVRRYPRFFSDEETRTMDSQVTLDEIKKVLEDFEKSKSPGPDGWTVEFFLEFFDILGETLRGAVEESRITGVVTGGLNATFITLIPKTDKPATFSDFRPISLCNLVYKLISKIISNRIKPALSSLISKEQFGFLDGRKIIDAIGVAQECIHSIKVKKMKALVLKLDLKKAYDRVNWDFLRLVLLLEFGLY
jgi:hypothetical protein